MRSGSWQKNAYLLLSSKSLLYILNSARSELTAYIYNEHSLEKITTFKLKKEVHSQESNGEINVSPAILTTDSR